MELILLAIFFILFSVALSFTTECYSNSLPKKVSICGKNLPNTITICDNKTSPSAITQTNANKADAQFTTANVNKADTQFNTANANKADDQFNRQVSANNAVDQGLVGLANQNTKTNIESRIENRTKLQLGQDLKGQNNNQNTFSRLTNTIFGATPVGVGTSNTKQDQAEADIVKSNPLSPKWVQYREIKSPKIDIWGTKAVTPGAMDTVKHIYTEITKRFKQPKFPLNKFDGYIIYITNGEPWSELENISPVGQMWGPTVKGVNRGDELRGGTNPIFLWISEQMICKTGIKTINQAFEEGRRKVGDSTYRSFDQVIHEFGHAIMFKYGLEDKVNEVYQGHSSPVEAFPWSIQYWFSSPEGELKGKELDFMNDIFSSKTTFPCSLYNQ